MEIESGPAVKTNNRRRKTSQNDHSHGSFFLRIGAIGNYFNKIASQIKFLLIYSKHFNAFFCDIAFGLGTMIYNGLEFGTFFELPMESPCYLILKGVNPLLQMIFTFMQMYFIFMNSRVSFPNTSYMEKLLKLPTYTNIFYKLCKIS